MNAKVKFKGKSTYSLDHSKNYPSLNDRYQQKSLFTKERKKMIMTKAKLVAKMPEDTDSA